MTFLPHNQISSRPTTACAFTLAEMLIAVTIFLFAVGGMICLQIFALRMYTLAATKTTATQTARETLNAMRDAIRSANTAYVGTYNPTNGSGFIQASNSTPQTGNALLLQYPDTNGNLTISNLFYLDPTQPVSADQPYDFPICSLINGVTNVLANYVTNYYVFSAEDCYGNFLSNTAAYKDNCVIHIIMQFDQWEYPVGFVGSNAINAYDFYRLTTRVARRCKQ
jgi:type II secretory pathway pseudopilin PulG